VPRVIRDRLRVFEKQTVPRVIQGKVADNDGGTDNENQSMSLLVLLSHDNVEFLLLHHKTTSQASRLQQVHLTSISSQLPICHIQL